MTAIASLAVGDTHEEVLVENLTRTQLVMYAGAAGDFTPLHTDEVYATRAQDQPAVLAQGMLLVAMAARVFTAWVGSDNVTRLAVRFVAPAFPGDTLTATATVTATRDDTGSPEVDFAVVMRNQHGAEVVRGSACARQRS